MPTFEGPVAKNKFATGPYLYSFSYRRQNFTPNCGKLFTFRACVRRLHRFGGAGSLIFCIFLWLRWFDCGYMRLFAVSALFHPPFF